MEASSQSPPSITDHFKKRKKATSQSLRISKSKLDVNLSENKINDDNLSTESNSTNIKQKLNRQKYLIDNNSSTELNSTKIRKKLNGPTSISDINSLTGSNSTKIRKKLNRQTPLSDINSTTESNSTKKRRKTVGQKSLTDKLDGENAEVQDEIRRTVWDFLDRSLREADIDLTAELDRSRKENSDVSGAVGSPGKEQSTLCDLDESIIKNVTYEEKESSVVAVTQSNESKIEEISFSEVHCSSSYEFDESILRNVCSENLAGPSGYGISSIENKAQRNVHSLSSSCDDSSFNTELNSPELINSIIEDLNDSTDLKVSENKEIIISDKAVEIEKSSDLMRAPQTESKSNKADVSNLEEFPIKWECEELEQSFSDLVDDVEKSMDEAQLTSTPKKRKSQPPDATSPTKKEKYSPHIVKSPKKYFGSSAKRKLIKDNQDSSPSSSSKTKSKGSSTVTSKTNNLCGSQKRISEYFSQSNPKSNVGIELLKKAIARRNSVDSLSRNSEDSKIFPSNSSAHLQIFEDCLQHIQKVILPVERYLFTEDEILFLKSVEDLNSSAKCIYFRLLVRKHNWIRKEKINFNQLSSSMDNDLKKLEELGLLSSDYKEEDIYILLELLTNPELRKLCRSFRVGDQGNKCSLILNLTKMSDRQSTLDGKHDSHFLIRKALKSTLDCVKLSTGTRETILKCLRIYSFSYNREVEEKLVQNIVKTFFEVDKYPKFVVKHALVWHNRENFDEYEKSLQLLSQVMAENKPNHEHLLELVDCARTKFDQYLSSESNRCILAKTPDYLMKFTAANVYAGIVFNNINVLKKDKTDKRRMDQAVVFLEKLLEEKHFLFKKRGQVYDALIRIYRQRKDFSKALSTFQKARKDELISHVIQFTLLAQMKPLLTQKAVPEQIKSKLKAVYHNQQTLFNCNSIETMTVSAKSTPSDKPNRKKVYVTETEDCTLYQSVEELVVNHFKKDGWYGVHDEGSLLKNIIFACFWDIIFSSPTLENDDMSVFVSKCQMRPLDWGSRQFYLRRESAIKQRLKEIEQSDWSEVNSRVVKCFKDHVGESFNKSIWKWIKSENLMNIEAFLMCLSTKFIASVAEWLLKDFGTYSSGFPDCTLWHRTNKQCLFVEVKSPSDTLAKHQEFWLTKIEEFGGNSRICHVREIASCSARLNS